MITLTPDIDNVKRLVVYYLIMNTMHSAYTKEKHDDLEAIRHQLTLEIIEEIDPILSWTELETAITLILINYNQKAYSLLDAEILLKTYCLWDTNTVFNITRKGEKPNEILNTFFKFQLDRSNKGTCKLVTDSYSTDRNSSMPSKTVLTKESLEDMYNLVLENSNQQEDNDNIDYPYYFQSNIRNIQPASSPLIYHADLTKFNEVANHQYNIDVPPHSYVYVIERILTKQLLTILPEVFGGIEIEFMGEEIKLND
jgi:hypothetical protein